MAQLNVSHLSHRFGPTDILADIHLSLRQGEVVSIVGPSGGGKTTLLHLCSGLLDVENGQIDNEFSSQAFAFQEARLLPWKTTLDNIAFGLKARGVSRQERYEKARRIALEFGLKISDLDKFPKDLSGGMRQRVSFARALVLKPEILFLDEPFSALDIGLKQELQSILIEQVTQHNLSVLFVTHDLTEAIKLSHRILVLGHSPGRVVRQIELTTPLTKRTDHDIHNELRQLLADPCIIDTFELNITQRGKQTV
ncbi:MAG: ABC transporter ATP-binding protein [Hydrogenovibrio sp.]